MDDVVNESSSETKQKREAQMRNINFCIDYLLETRGVDEESKVSQQSQIQLVKNKESIEVLNQTEEADQQNEENNSQEDCKEESKTDD